MMVRDMRIEGCIVSFDAGSEALGLGVLYLDLDTPIGLCMVLQTVSYTFTTRLPTVSPRTQRPAFAKL